ncbi:unnamed protein product [Amoebophrya sp. A120]|nr:unnamed protein product [Amoebophrya sp. A120]|eukprot:GSA120T00004085001.1
MAQHMEVEGEEKYTLTLHRLHDFEQTIVLEFDAPEVSVEQIKRAVAARSASERGLERPRAWQLVELVVDPRSELAVRARNDERTGDEVAESSEGGEGICKPAGAAQGRDDHSALLQPLQVRKPRTFMIDLPELAAATELSSAAEAANITDEQNTMDKMNCEAEQADTEGEGEDATAVASTSDIDQFVRFYEKEFEPFATRAELDDAIELFCFWMTIPAEEKDWIHREWVTDSITTEHQYIVAERVIWRKDDGHSFELNAAYQHLTRAEMEQKWQDITDKHGPMVTWDVSRVSSLRELFAGIAWFECDISGWCTTNVTSMEGMFGNCDRFNSEVSDWDMRSVVDASGMFGHCYRFNQPVGGWDTASLQNGSALFCDCFAFNQPVNHLNVSKCFDLSFAFSGCAAFNQSVADWDVGECHDMTGMFEGCRAYNQPMDNWDVSSATKLSCMFQSCTNFEQNLDSWLDRLKPMTKIRMAKIFANCPKYCRKKSKMLQRAEESELYEQSENQKAVRKWHETVTTPIITLT